MKCWNRWSFACTFSNIEFSIIKWGYKWDGVAAADHFIDICTRASILSNSIYSPITLQSLLYWQQTAAKTPTQSTPVNLLHLYRISLELLFSNQPYTLQIQGRHYRTRALGNKRRKTQLFWQTENSYARIFGFQTTQGGKRNSCKAYRSAIGGWSGRLESY